MEGRDNCDMNAVCSDSVGSFTCDCVDGFIGNGTTCAGIQSQYHCTVLSSLSPIKCCVLHMKWLYKNFILHSPHVQLMSPLHTHCTHCGFSTWSTYSTLIKLLAHPPSSTLLTIVNAMICNYVCNAVKQSTYYMDSTLRVNDNFCLEAQFLDGQ